MRNEIRCVLNSFSVFFSVCRFRSSDELIKKTCYKIKLKLFSKSQSEIFITSSFQLGSCVFYFGI